MPSVILLASVNSVKVISITVIAVDNKEMSDRGEIKEAVACQASCEAPLRIESQRSVEMFASGPADEGVVILTDRCDD